MAHIIQKFNYDFNNLAHHTQTHANANANAYAYAVLFNKRRKNTHIGSLVKTFYRHRTKKLHILTLLFYHLNGYINPIQTVISYNQNIYQILDYFITLP